MVFLKLKIKGWFMSKPIRDSKGHFAPGKHKAKKLAKQVAKKPKKVVQQKSITFATRNLATPGIMSESVKRHIESYINNKFNEYERSHNRFLSNLLDSLSYAYDDSELEWE
jgi:hypothetical protein